MLTDKAKLTIKAGNGGNGGVSFGRDKKPSGGDGGNGGSVYIEGSRHIYDLGYFNHTEDYEAGNGEPGGAEGRQGKFGKDLVLKVPIVCKVFSESGYLITQITEHGQRYTLAEGGRGGLGNYNFRSGQAATLYKTTHGKAGLRLPISLELNLTADVLLIGFPNAGKSSLLNALTNANSKVAAYPFTTLEPHLGVSNTMVLMDLPGLIEGTAYGKGLGKDFVKHTSTAKLVAHVISLESTDIFKDYKAMRKELEAIDIKLADKPEIIILSKSDLSHPDVIAKTVKSLAKLQREVFVVSTYDLDALTDLGKLLQNRVLSSTTA